MIRIETLEYPKHSAISFPRVTGYTETGQMPMSRAVHPPDHACPNTGQLLREYLFEMLLEESSQLLVSMQ